MSQFGSSQFQGQRPIQQTPVNPPKPAPVEDDGAIGLIGDSEGASIASKIKAIGGGESTLRKERWTRKAINNGTGACRMRSFHGRLSAQGLEYMDNQINEWLDQHPDVEVKFVTSNVGVFEGKMREPALILNLWY
jgi:hypothetical protein